MSNSISSRHGVSDMKRNLNMIGEKMIINMLTSSGKPCEIFLFLRLQRQQYRPQDGVNYEDVGGGGHWRACLNT